MNAARKLDDLNLVVDELTFLKEKIRVLHRVQAVIEFELTGNILTANENFLKTFMILDVVELLQKFESKNQVAS